MKTLYLAIIIITTVPLLSSILPIEAQCYGCGQNSSALKQGLLEKQLGLTGPPRSFLISRDNENNSWLTVVGIGSIVGGVTVAISVYVIRIRK